MKISRLFFTCNFLCCFAFASAQEIDSKVYSWNNIANEETSFGNQKSIFSGETTDLEQVTLQGLTLNGKRSFNSTSNLENLVIVKEGTVQITLKGQKIKLTPSSIALVMPNEPFMLSNNTDNAATFYLMSYVGKKLELSRVTDSTGSVVKVWEDIAFNPHDKGGIRNYFNQPTVMTEYFEMHVTNLNGLIKSHEPHTHRAAEIVLMIKGNTEMQIGDSLYKGTQGDVYFLGSNVPHAIQNIESDQCMYFAFQWN